MRWHAQTAEDTEAFGGQLAKARPAGARRLSVIYLTGDLGSGKTTLARGFLRALGVAGPVRSPTYTLLELYETPDLAVLHLDLYRLQDSTELENLGLREWAREGYAWLIEWPERGAGRLPPADLYVTLRAGALSHEIEATARTTFGKSWLRGLAATATATTRGRRKAPGPRGS